MALQTFGSVYELHCSRIHDLTRGKHWCYLEDDRKREVPKLQFQNLNI